MRHDRIQRYWKHNVMRAVGALRARGKAAEAIECADCEWWHVMEEGRLRQYP